MTLNGPFQISGTWRFCADCRCWMRRGTWAVVVEGAHYAHAKQASCKAAARRKAQRGL